MFNGKCFVFTLPSRLHRITLLILLKLQRKTKEKSYVYCVTPADKTAAEARNPA